MSLTKLRGLLLLLLLFKTQLKASSHLLTYFMLNYTILVEVKIDYIFL